MNYHDYDQDESYERTIILSNLLFRNDQLFFNMNRPVSLSNESKKIRSYFIKNINEYNRNFQFYLFDIHVRGKIVNEYDELIKINIQYNKFLSEKQLQKLAKYIEAFMLNLDPLHDKAFESKESFYEYHKEVSDNYLMNDYQNYSSSYQSSDFSQNDNNYCDNYEDNDYYDNYDEW